MVSFTRRTYLKWLLAGAGALTGTAAGARFLLPARGESFSGLTHVTSAEAKILAAIYSAITGEESAQALQAAVPRLDGFLANLSRLERLELRAALQLVEQTPLFFHGYLSRFTGLSGDDRAVCLEGWRMGADWRRMLFSGLKELCYLIRYTESSSWNAIGYTGPLVPAPGEDPALPERYAALMAPR